MTYRVANWIKHYETSETRKLVHARWLPLPNKHDGKGFRRLSRLKDKIEVFGAWVLILQVASKMPVRGVLSDEDGPLTSVDLSDMTGFPNTIFEKAFSELTRPEIGWLELSEGEYRIPECTGENPKTTEKPAESAAVPAASPELAGHSRTEGKDSTGKVLQGSERGTPTVEECKDMAVRMGMPDTQGEDFWHHYNAQGWVNGSGHTITSWTSLMHRWKAKWENGIRSGFSKGPASSQDRVGVPINSIAQADSVIAECKAQMEACKHHTDVDGVPRFIVRPEMLEQFRNLKARVEHIRAQKAGLK